MQVSTLRRRSYENLTVIPQSNMRIQHTCHCGALFQNEHILRAHQQSDCSSYRLSCSFCTHRFQTTEELRVHLVQCGNKTDMCPVCNEYIRRSHFAYHYENNCADVSHVDRSPKFERVVPARTKFQNQNRPIARNDIIHDYSIQERPQSHIPYENEKSQHRQSPSLPPNQNMNRRQPLRSVPIKHDQQNDHKNSIPCEICSAMIEPRAWPSHIDQCMNRDNHRIRNLAEKISREPINEEIPCEYCNNTFPVHALRTHQFKCPNNPSNRGNPPSSQKFRDEESNKFHQRPTYHKIDVDRTHDANNGYNNHHQPGNQRGSASGHQSRVWRETNKSNPKKVDSWKNGQHQRSKSADHRSLTKKSGLMSLLSCASKQAE